MNFQSLVDFVTDNERSFNAPYGVITGNGTSKKGKPYTSLTFGVSRYLDAEIQYYGPNFIIVRGQGALTRKFEKQKYTVQELMVDLQKFI